MKFPPLPFTLRGMKEIWQSDELIAHVQRLLNSFKRWTGRELLATRGSAVEDARDAWFLPAIIVSHEMQADPVLNYGNAAALALWEMDWTAFTSTPSRLTAEPHEREVRARLMAQVTRDGFIDITPAFEFPAAAGVLKSARPSSGIFSMRMSSFAARRRHSRAGNIFSGKNWGNEACQRLSAVRARRTGHGPV
jgi:hypothetical protein